ncbi:hypothetical protein, partial [Thiolapillus sp.]|uniref:hypothetical protein n=1 Tax=Thiolapillus sp. TaxID=2017437 RepID=UPI003AF475DD
MSNLSCKLLLVDSDVADAELAGDLLRQSFPHCELVTVTVLFAKSLPPNVKDLQSASVPSAILKKDEAGFLKLADT